MAEETPSILIRGGRVYDHDGDTDLPPVADVLIEGDRIARIGAGLGPADRTIDAAGKLVMPGFINAHYHSHDVLLKGCFETLPLELWLLHALPPAYPRRSAAEVRADAAGRGGMPAVGDDDRPGHADALPLRSRTSGDRRRRL